MVGDLLRDVDDEIEINELTRKLKIFDSMENLKATPEAEEEPVPDGAETAAVDIREDLTEDDLATFEAHQQRRAHAAPEKKQAGPAKTVSFKDDTEIRPKSKEVKPLPNETRPNPIKPTSPAVGAVKERVVERKPKRTVIDPSTAATAKQVREQMFRRALRKDATEDGEAKETLSPQ